METAVVIAIIKDILLGLSAVVVAVFAWIGLKTWRRELTGKARFETARSMMRLGSELKAAFEQARNPFTMAYEWADRSAQEGESGSESQVLNEWYARSKRLNSVVESFNKIIEVQWEAEILLDKNSVQDVKEAVKSYRESLADLSSAVSSYFDVSLDTVRTGQPYRDQNWLRELRKTIFSASGDDFSKKVEEATDKLSSALKQYVK